MLPIQYIRIMGFVYQGAVPQIIEKTTDDFYSKIISILRETADTCFDRIKDIPCMTCPQKPEGSMFVMVRTENRKYYAASKYRVYDFLNYKIPLQVKLNLSLLEDIENDMDFCMKLSKEESVIVFPGKERKT